MDRIRPRSPGASPGASPEPGWGAQPEGPGPAKRLRLDQPADLRPSALPDAPSSSVMILPAHCLAQVTVDGVNLLLEPPPASALQVSIQDHKLFIIPEGLLHTVTLCPAELRAFQAPLQGDPRVARMNASPGCGASPAVSPHSADGPRDDLVHLLRPFPGSSLKPLPPSPPSSPQAPAQKPQVSRSPACKACRRLF